MELSAALLCLYYFQFCTSVLKCERGGIANGLKLHVKPVVCVLDSLTDEVGSQKIWRRLGGRKGEG